MTIINGATKKGQKLLRWADYYDGYYLDDVYGSYSCFKARAWRDCYDKCVSQHGRDFHIVSHNTNMFTVAWVYDDPETGELMTRIETNRNTYIIDGTRPNIV